MKPDFEAPGCRLYLALWPIVVIDVGDASRDAYVALFKTIDEKVVARREPYVTITDTRRVHSVPTADVRKVMADWMKKNAVGHTSLGAVTIVRSTLVRGAMTALYWLFTPPNPQGMAADWSEALCWSVARFEEARIPLRPSVRESVAQPY